MRASPAILPFRSRQTRRDEAAKQFAAIGQTSHRDDEHETWARRLRHALEDQGPVLRALAVYLGSRIDLLSGAQCQELRIATDACRPMSGDELRCVLSREWNGGARAVNVDVVPAWVGPVSQTYRGSLADGMGVRVDVLTVHEAELSRELELLPVVYAAFKGRVHEQVLSRALDDFRARLRARCSLTERLASASAVAQGGRNAESALIPVPRPELCTARIFVSEVEVDEGGGGAPGGARTLAEAQATAGLIASGWLRQALFGSVLPLFESGEPVALAGGRIIAHGPVAMLPRPTQAHLLAYLLAVAGDSPERAWESLRPELVSLPHAASAGDVARAFRCLVPFRDDHFEDSRSALADHMFLQWRCASEHGWVAPPHVAPFYEGLHAMVLAVRGGAGGRDLLADALQELRLTAHLRQLEDWTRGADFSAELEQQVAMLMELPQKIDRLLSVAASGMVRLQGPVAEPERRPAPHGAFALTVGTALAAGLVLWSASTEVLRSAAMTQPLRALIAMAAGALILWVLERAR
jgi:hypothetical protein